MTKRNTEGYVLAYLLIVIAVMGAIAATLMTSTVQVMASQQNSIQYMKDKYEAMGEIECVFAEIEKYVIQSGDGDTFDAQKAFYKFINTDVLDNDDDSESNSDIGDYYAVVDGDEDIYSFTFDFQANKGTVSIKTTICVLLCIKVTSTSDTETPPNVIDTYEITFRDIETKSYEITPVEVTPDA